MLAKNRRKIATQKRAVPREYVVQYETTTPLAARLKAARAKLQLTQAQAARRWRVNQRTLEGWEAGHAPLAIFRAKLERALRQVEGAP
jgi:DNA-binding transcriptional regulator YiaG